MQNRPELVNNPSLEDSRVGCSSKVCQIPVSSRNPNDRILFSPLYLKSVLIRWYDLNDGNRSNFREFFEQLSLPYDVDAPENQDSPTLSNQIEQKRTSGSLAASGHSSSLTGPLYIAIHNPNIDPYRDFQ